MILKAWVLVLMLGQGEILDSFDSRKECLKARARALQKTPGLQLECMTVDQN